MKEEWKDIPGYEGLYQVSTMGRVKSLSREIISSTGNYVSKEKILTTTGNDGLGYVRLQLFKNNKGKLVRAHRLVAMAFIPNPENKCDVNHKNGNKSDNRVENLEWATRSENEKHSYYILNKKRLTKKIMCLETGEQFDSILSAAKKYNTRATCISRVLRKKRKTYNKKHWVYL